MALISFSIIPIYIIIFAISRNYSRKNYEESRELNGNENIVFKNIVECMPVIRIFNAKSFYFSKIQDMLIKIINKNIKIYLFENIILTSLYIINTLIPILIIITGISLIANNEITIGVLIVFYTYSFRLIPLINQFVNFFYFYQQVYFSYKKVNKIFEYDEPKDNFIMNDIKFDINKILIKNLSVERNGKKILHNINLEFNKKDIVCLYGENGCGKTTLLNVISGLLKAEQGDIYIDDMNIENINPELYFEYVTYLPQNCYLLNDTIINNITMGRKIDMNTIIQVCNKLCIYDFINSLEDKFNFKITGNGEKLSGGERKMICFARMLLHKAKIILLDEFSNDLDNKHKKIINNILTEIKDNSIIIYVTHFNEDIGLANKFIYLHEGKILNVICENLEAKISKLVMDL